MIGCAGSNDKCKWLKDDLGFDFVFNYKTEKLVDALKQGAPNGIDCYFDNVSHTPFLSKAAIIVTDLDPL